VNISSVDSTKPSWHCRTRTLQKPTEAMEYNYWRRLVKNIGARELVETKIWEERWQ